VYKHTNLQVLRCKSKRKDDYFRKREKKANLV
jgi:hypothetical protein